MMTMNGKCLHYTCSIYSLDNVITFASNFIAGFSTFFMRGL